MRTAITAREWLAPNYSISGASVMASVISLLLCFSTSNIRSHSSDKFSRICFPIELAELSSMLWLTQTRISKGVSCSRHMLMKLSQPSLSTAILLDPLNVHITPAVPQARSSRGSKQRSQN